MEQLNAPQGSGGASKNATTIAYANSLIVWAGPARLFIVNGYNSKVAVQFIQIFDSATVPIDGAIPAIVLSVPAASGFFLDLNVYGRLFANGVTIVNSSTGPTKTIGAADTWIDVQFMPGQV